MQPHLIPGHYRCDGCGRDVDHVARFKRFRFCPACVEQIVPTWSPLRGGDGATESEEDVQSNLHFWEWYWDVGHHLRPTRYHPPRGKLGENQRTADSYFPLCDCGRPREPYKHILGHAPRGLFGGPFPPECPTCEARRQVESYVKDTSWLRPEWDDEEWLDFLWRVAPDAFTLGVLPDYWYELRRQRAQE